MSEQGEIEALKQELDYYIKTRSPRAVAKRLNLIEVKLPLAEYCKILVERAQKAPQFFTEKITLLPYITDYVFKNYCLYEGEELIDKFRGKVQIKKTYLSGTLYLTNYRIWTFEKLVSPGTFHPYGILGLIDFLIQSGIDSVHRTFVKSAVKSLHNDLTPDKVLEWGYSLPFFKTINIKRTKKYISYSLSTEVKGKKKIIEITVTPALKIARYSIFSQIEKYLLDNQ
ncbi:MAG: hypothetical protein HWN81_16770 [Candidatus Lokiarchaeota archaeon]|nr:hypothetical protein [Candidatus Lokiarchaeota archaeon]